MLKTATATATATTQEEGSVIYILQFSSGQDRAGKIAAFYCYLALWAGEEIAAVGGYDTV